MVKTCVVRRASFVAALLFAPVSLHAQDIIGIPVGETPPAITLESLTGDSVPLSQWIGKKPVIIEFWATWCPICAALLPKMEAAQKKFGDRAEFLVVAVAELLLRRLHLRQQCGADRAPRRPEFDDDRLLADPLGQRNGIAGETLECDRRG